MMSIGDKPFRQLDSRSWDIERRLADMDRDGVAVQVLSPMPELLSYWLDVDAAVELGKAVNGAIAGVAARRPDRFWSLATLPMQSADAALAALPRLRADGFRGIEIGSNVNGRYLGDAEFAPVFEAAAALDMAVFIHALHPLQAPHLKSFPELVPFAGFVTDTGLSAATLLMSGILERNPTLRVGLSHGGGTLAPIVHRMDKGWHMTSGFEGKLAAPPSTTASRFFLDSLVYDVRYARHLMEFAPGRVCLGTDYPYLIEQTRPRDFIDALASGEDDAVWNVAATQFLGGSPS
jgi:aminocarboxymuconate-semialdehyde decarboxylase